jgi:hypothetical protein
LQENLSHLRIIKENKQFRELCENLEKKISQKGFFEKIEDLIILPTLRIRE